MTPTERGLGWAESGSVTLYVFRPGILELAGGDPFGGAPVRLGNVVLDVLAADAPHTATTDLESPQLACLDQRMNLVGFHVQLFGYLGGCHKAVVGGFVSHPAILCATAVSMPGLKTEAQDRAKKEREAFRTLL